MSAKSVKNKSVESMRYDKRAQTGAMRRNPLKLSHNLKVAGSNPAPATRKIPSSQWLEGFLILGAVLSSRTRATVVLRRKKVGLPGFGWKLLSARNCPRGFFKFVCARRVAQRRLPRSVACGQCLHSFYVTCRYVPAACLSASIWRRRSRIRVSHIRLRFP